GNPGNKRGVDRVLVTAPCDFLPPGTEVVDTPGTGSVNLANTDEARRALSTLDVAVLVVAADPPVSVAELDLVADAMGTASRAIVVVNKADLLADDELAEVVDFTARVVAERLGQPVQVFPLSALPARRRCDGFDTFAAWLAGELESHGSAHALASTARALRREATVLRDALRVQEELLRRRGEYGTATIAALSEILDRAGDRARAAGCAAARCCASWRAGARRLSRAPSVGPARHCRSACARRTELPSAASRPPAPSTSRRCSRA
ncbi:MAG: GTP-binding protein, partial [Pseudonocardiaceae bacterium]